MQQAIEIRHLDHAFGEGALVRQVLFDIHLEVSPGEIVILSGPSGCGKTTLLTLTGGLRSVQKGSLTVLGAELAGADKQALMRLRRRVGFIFQAHNLLEFLTARQNVRLALELEPGDAQVMDERALQMLDSVGLGEKLNAYPEKLSGGQKQRVAVARALVHRPGLVLADEPTASLDSKSGRAVVELLQQLARDQGTAILMVTHDHRVLDVADRIVRMEDGHIVGIEVP